MIGFRYPVGHYSKIGFFCYFPITFVYRHPSAAGPIDAAAEHFRPSYVGKLRARSANCTIELISTSWIASCRFQRSTSINP